MRVEGGEGDGEGEGEISAKSSKEIVGQEKASLHCRVLCLTHAVMINEPFESLLRLMRFLA